MAVSRALRRLLRVLDLEEEQRRTALASAQAELGRLERTLKAAGERERSGRRLVTASARTGELSDRLVGIAEVHAAEHRTRVLEPRIADSEEEVAERQAEFLAKRVERRQTETLVEEAEAREAALAQRRGQQTLDEWYLNRKRTGGDDEREAAGNGQLVDGRQGKLEGN